MGYRDSTLGVIILGVIIGRNKKSAIDLPLSCVALQSLSDQPSETFPIPWSRKKFLRVFMLFSRVTTMTSGVHRW